jgi:hypothetical protein
MQKPWKVSEDVADATQCKILRHVLRKEQRYEIYKIYAFKIFFFREVFFFVKKKPILGVKDNS